MLRHWSQFVPNMSTVIQGHEALHHHLVEGQSDTQCPRNGTAFPIQNHWRQTTSRFTRPYRSSKPTHYSVVLGSIHEFLMGVHPIFDTHTHTHSDTQFLSLSLSLLSLSLSPPPPSLSLCECERGNVSHSSCVSECVCASVSVGVC